MPLSDQALAILEGITATDGRDLVFGLGAGGFSGWSKAKSELNERIAKARRQGGVEEGHAGMDNCTICADRSSRTSASTGSRRLMS